MRPSALKAFIASRFKGGIARSIHIESSPGIGKTQIASQVAKELGVGFMVIHAPLLNPEDYGFPVVNAAKNDVDFVVPSGKFPMVGTDCPETGIFLIDELPQADNSAQKVLANLLQEREIHGKKLKPGWLIVTTGNRTTDRAGANRLLSHLGNRVTKMALDASLDDWTAWALENDIKPEVISFIRFRPDLLNTFDPQTEVSATPRSWAEGVSASLGVVDPSHEMECFQGDVGQGPAAEFLGFLRIFRDLPSPDAIMLDPQGTKVPKDPATQYALCGALSHKATADNFARAMEYIKRLPPEFSVLFVRDTIKKTPSIQTTKAFIAWAAKDGAALLS